MHQQLDEFRQVIGTELAGGVSPESINLDQEATLEELGVHSAAFDAARINEAVLEVRYAHHESVPEPMRGMELYIIPDVHAGTVRWRCEGSLHRRYQPGFCRESGE